MVTIIPGVKAWRWWRWKVCVTHVPSPRWREHNARQRREQSGESRCSLACAPLLYPALRATVLSVFDHLFPFSLFRVATNTSRRRQEGPSPNDIHQCQNCQKLILTDYKTALSHSTLSSLLCTMYLLCAGVLVVVARYVDGRMLLFKFQYPIIQHNAQHFNLHISVTFGKIECRVRFK